MGFSLLLRRCITKRKSSIKRNKEQEQVYLALLNEHFETVSFEPYNDAMMNLIFTNACDKILGKSFAKKRISLRKEKKIKDEVTRRVRNKYGRWVSLTHFKINNVNKTMYFNTNLDRVFTVAGQGKLYGSYYHSCCGNIFFTEHCLERFEERIGPILYDHLAKKLEESLNGPATSVDILSGMTLSGDLEYGRHENYYHLNANVGILVLEDFGDVFIAKTFLSPEMIKPIKWYKPDIYNRDVITSFSGVINCKCDRIENPTFIKEVIQKALEAQSL